ncbi:MAG: tetratricopeptide repeat protein [Candidatus Krumholzibacteria bacterium]|jgi:tetratricopeptide (TPR) repeat protein|nr:tetratricopeptide repeat protein [Candidatus Krumholzibacteria bacterium]
MNDFCNDEEMLAAYLDRMLPDEERILYEKHLSGCPACMSELISSSAAYEEIAGHSKAAGARHGRAGARGMLRADGSRQGSPGMFALPRHVQGRIAIAASLVIVLSSALIIHNRDSGLKPVRREVYGTVKALWPGELRLSFSAGPPAGERGRIRGAGYDGAILEESERALREALARDPGSIEARRLLGHLFMVRNHPAMAEIHYKRILDADPRNGAAMNDLALACYRRGDLAKAIAMLESAAAEGCAIPETCYNLAVMLIESGDVEKARSSVERYLSIDPSSPWSQRLREISGSRAGE